MPFQCCASVPRAVRAGAPAHPELRVSVRLNEGGLRLAVGLSAQTALGPPPPAGSRSPGPERM
eukprot:15431186-Alexandrium_andersonii.AAC.1